MISTSKWLPRQFRATIRCPCACRNAQALSSPNCPKARFPRTCMGLPEFDHGDAGAAELDVLVGR